MTVHASNFIMCIAATVPVLCCETSLMHGHGSTLCISRSITGRSRRLTLTFDNTDYGKLTYHKRVVLKLVSEIEVSDKVSALLGSVPPRHGSTHRAHLYVHV